MDLDMSYDRNGYIYRVNNDSLYYIGILIPLKQDNKVEQRLFTDFSSLPTENGYQRRVSPDGKMQAAWNNNVLFLFTGSINNRYFEQEEVANRYGIEIPQYDAAVDAAYAEAAVEAIDFSEDDIEVDTSEAEEWEEDELEAIEEAAAAVDSVAAIVYEEATLADSVETLWEAHDFTLEGDSIEGYTYNYGDDEYDNDAYTDSMYQIEMARNAKNDSIRNNLFTTWLAHDFNTYLTPQKKSII